MATVFGWAMIVLGTAGLLSWIAMIVDYTRLRRENERLREANRARYE